MSLWFEPLSIFRVQGGTCEYDFLLLPVLRGGPGWGRISRQNDTYPNTTAYGEGDNTVSDPVQSSFFFEIADEPFHLLGNRRTVMFRSPIVLSFVVAVLASVFCNAQPTSTSKPSEDAWPLYSKAAERVVEGRRSKIECPMSG